MKSHKWMRICKFMAEQLSTCSKRQYAAVILDPQGRVVGMGYNGSPPGFAHCTDGACPRAVADSPSFSPYDNCIACHAEDNAITYSDPSARRGSALYVNGTPCWDCGKKIANSGLAEVFYMEDPGFKDWPRVKSFIEQAGIKLTAVDIEV